MTAKRRTAAQVQYDEVAAVERQITEVMDEIPYVALQGDRAASALRAPGRGAAMNARLGLDHARVLALASELYRLLEKLQAKGAVFKRSFFCSEQLMLRLAETTRGLTLRPSAEVSTLLLGHRYRWAEPSCRPVKLAELGRAP